MPAPLTRYFSFHILSGIFIAKLRHFRHGLRMKVSVAIITRNEAGRLPNCLESLTFADDILVVDSGSSDPTVSIAEEFGCRVLSEAWRGYAKQKQFAVDNCLYDLVLILDADERIPLETAEGIKGITQNENQLCAAYSFSRKNFFHNRWIRHCGWWPDRIVRLVDRRRGQFSDRLVHEQWLARGPVKALDFSIEHYSFRNYSDLIHKMEAYSSLSALEMLRKRKRVGWLPPITHGVWMFLRTYLLERGFLEGFDGLVISILNAGGSFLKYAKYREIRSDGSSGV